MLCGFIVFLFYKEGTKSPLVLFDAKKTDELSELFSQAQELEPLSIESYSYSPPEFAHDHGNVIDLATHNKPVSQYIQGVTDEAAVFIVPGFIPPLSSAMKTNTTSRERMNWAVKQSLEVKYPVFIVSGGNVKPVGTPFNEALEMKRYLMKEHNVPEFMIALEPYAQNTVTNLRNTGRFLLAHGIKEATIVTTFGQNIYVGFGDWTFFKTRSRRLLGYDVGEVRYLSEKTSHFRPNQEVLRRSTTQVDP